MTDPLQNEIEQMDESMYHLSAEYGKASDPEQKRTKQTEYHELRDRREVLVSERRGQILDGLAMARQVINELLADAGTVGLEFDVKATANQIQIIRRVEV